MDSQANSKIVIVKGKISIYPNTLNNQIFTYFVADYWARKHLQGREQYSYDNWISFIQKIAEINKNYKDLIVPKQDMKLFSDWGVYGDGMTLAEFLAVGEFDPDRDEQIRIYNQQQQYPITSKFGQHKSAIADVDADAQSLSRWFGLELKDLKESSYMKFKQNSLKNMSFRVLSDTDTPGIGRGYLLKADWCLIGQKYFYPNQISEQAKKILLSQRIPRNSYLKVNQYRYNQQSKLSSGLGYVTETNVKLNSLNMQGWRIIMIQNFAYGLPCALLLKLTKKGLLLDIAGLLLDTNDKERNPVYPELFTIHLFYESNKQQILNWTAGKEGNKTIEQINDMQGGLIFIKGITSLKKEAISAKGIISISMQQSQQLKSNHKFQIFGIQTQYHLSCEQSIKKSKLTDDRPLFNSQFLNQVEINFCCTRFGEPFTGDVTVYLIPSTWHNSSSIEQFIKIDQTIKRALQNESFRALYKSRDYINQKFYQGKLSQITELAKDVFSRFNQNLDWKIMKNGKPTEQIFQVQFYDTDEEKRLVTFKQGKGTIKVKLNVALTKQNNSRRPAINSLVVHANFAIDQEPQQIGQNAKVAIVFYQTGPQIEQKSQWATNVGLALKRYALLYPSMQKIANLYDFEKLKLLSLRRVFDVEDENNPRYMPSTRQMSIFEHRQIRKWFYEPVFNSKIMPHGVKRYKHFIHKLSQLTISHNLLDSHNRIQVYTAHFQQRKKEVTKDLRQAFQIELTTIPLYLSAMFSLDSSYLAHSIIREVVKDEMKHLFIVSNMLNSIFDQKLLGYKSAVPYSDPKYIPHYPIKNKNLPGIFLTQNQELVNLLSFDIQPCTADQIIKFAMLQLPGELDNLKFEYKGSLKNQVSHLIEDRVDILNRKISLIKEELEVNDKFKTIGQFYSNIIEKFWYLHDLQEYINKKSTKTQHKVNLFSGEATKQFTYFGLDNMSEIYDLRSALNQFMLIIEEGEGSNLFSVNINKDNEKKSHFLKFVEVYTGCSAKVHPSLLTTHQLYTKDQLNLSGILNSKVVPTEVKITLEDDKQKYIDLINSEKRWSKQADKEVKKMIKKQFSGESVKQDDSSYTDAYAKVALNNAYRSMMSQLDFIFNMGFQQFSAQFKNQKIEEIQLKQMFDSTRRSKMESSIASMRQIRLHADKVIRYSRSSDDPSVHFELGSRPNFNLDINSINQ